MRTAFVLSGGANLGAAQVGMLALDAADIQPDLVVGTSVGAINGAWVATRQPLTGLAEVWRGLRRGDVFSADPLSGFLGFVGRRDHLVSGRGLRQLLERHPRFTRPEDAAVPFHVVAADVLTGVDVRLSSGPAVEAILASAAIPGVLPPIEVAGRALMDGEVVNNTPISHAVALGADTVWVPATGYACALTEPRRSALGMALHAVILVVHQRLTLNIEQYAGLVDLRVVPPLCPIAVPPTEFSQAALLIDRAQAHTRDWLARGAARGRKANPVDLGRHGPAARLTGDWASAG